MRRIDAAERDLILIGVALISECLTSQDVPEIVDRVVGNGPRVSTDKTSRVAPCISWRSIRELRSAASHVLLVIETKVRDMACILRQVHVKTCYVGGKLNGKRRVELESTRVNTVANPEVVRGIPGGCIRQDSYRDRIYIHERITRRRIRTVVEACSQIVELSSGERNRERCSIWSTRGKPQQSLSQTRQWDQPVDRSLPRIATAFIVVKEEETILNLSLI